LANIKIVDFIPLMVIFIGLFFITNIKVGNRIHQFSFAVLFTNSVSV